MRPDDFAIHKELRRLPISVNKDGHERGAYSLYIMQGTLSIESVESVAGIDHEYGSAASFRKASLTA